MSVIKGSDMMLFVGGKSVAYATNHSLTISADTKETSSKDSGGKWQTSEVGVLSWTCSTENLCCEDGAGMTYKELVNLMLARKPITGVFAIEGNSTNLDEGKLDAAPTTGWTAKAANGYTGQMIITNIDLNAPNGDNATFKVDFTGVGALTEVAAKA